MGTRRCFDECGCRRSYETFLKDLYITVEILADSGVNPLDSNQCRFLTTGYLMTLCLDPGYFHVPMRDSMTGDQLRDLQGNPRFLNVGSLLSQMGGSTYGGVTLTDTQTDFYRLEGTPTDTSTIHHEQVHAQQWARTGWQFANDYIGESTNDVGLASSWYRQYGWDFPSFCFNTYEKQAGLVSGGYTDGYTLQWYADYQKTVLYRGVVSPCNPKWSFG